ncbi:MAG TPA: hypothetical protein VFH82_11545 [Gemmatimonadota bacterium]|nr:hypothetical protein [Gemmatimonadota bacterium]
MAAVRGGLRGAIALAALTAAMSACAGSPGRTHGDSPLGLPSLTPQRSGTEAQLIGLHAVDGRVAWAAGARGTWVRTTDGGATWVTGTVAGAESLQFRDVHALDARTAWLLSIGNGPDSRIYRTDDGGSTWDLQFQATDERAFYDCFDFWDARSGIAFSDSHDGEFPLIATADGRTWTPLPTDRLPDASQGEGAFAASGTCVVTRGDSLAWFGTGAGAEARAFRTTDRGRSWEAVVTPLAQGTATTGTASVAFLDDLRGVVMGGDVGEPAKPTDSVAVTEDGGRTWRLVGRPERPGAIYGGAFLPGAPTPTLVAVGPSGVAVSTDFATTWATVDTLEHWSVAFGAPGVGWAVGPSGRISRIDFRR